MLKMGYSNIYAYDEIALDSFKKNYPNLKINYCKSIKEIITKTSNIILLTKFDKIKKLKNKKIIDLKYQI